MRLFVAIDVPRDIADATANAIEPWRDRVHGARWVPVGNWHVTVKFLGETTHEIAERTAARLDEVAGRVVPFATNLTGLGAFPSPAAARVVWAGLNDRAGRMAELALAVEAALSGSFAPSNRPFAPHLTLARVDPPVRLPEAFATTAVSDAPFTVGALVLLRSRLGRPAPRYETLARPVFRG